MLPISALARGPTVPNFPPRLLGVARLDGESPRLSIGADGSLHFCLREGRASDLGIGHICQLHVGVGEIRFGEIRSKEFGLDHFRAREIASDLGEEKIALAQIRS